MKSPAIGRAFCFGRTSSFIGVDKVVAEYFAGREVRDCCGVLVEQDQHWCGGVCAADPRALFCFYLRVTLSAVTWIVFEIWMVVGRRFLRRRTAKVSTTLTVASDDFAFDRLHA